MDEIILDNGKYRFHMNEGILQCERYDERWRDFCGDNAVHLLFLTCLEAKQCLTATKVLCEKFIGKVDSGRARSVETYAECKALLKMIKDTEVRNA